MVIEIRTDIFEDLNSLGGLKHLIGLLSYNSRHLFLCDIDKIKELPVYSKLMDIDKELIERYFDIIIEGSKKINAVISKNSTKNSFDINEAIIYFQQPFEIILENGNNDGYFLNALINNFKKKAKKIAHHKKNGWLIYGNAGGADTMINYLKCILARFNELPKENYNYLRCIVLVDSDKKYPSDAPIEKRQKIFDFFDSIAVPYHELEKREIENYLPDEVIETITGNDDFIKAYIRLKDPMQKDYFDLENGFPDEDFARFEDDIRNLYYDVSDDDIKIFRKNKIKMNGSFKAEFPKLFEHERVSQQTLINRVRHQTKDPNELVTILEKISDLL